MKIEWDTMQFYLYQEGTRIDIPESKIREMIIYAQEEYNKYHD